MKKIFNNSWFTLAFILLATIFGFTTNWLAWVWFLIYVGLWIAYAEKK